MFRKLMTMFALMAFLAAPSYAADWGFNDYYEYDGGYFDSTSSDLYDINDDWYYDAYTMGDAQQREEDAGLWDNSYGWEADDDLFADDI